MSEVDRTSHLWVDVAEEDLDYAREIAREYGVSLEADEEAGFVDPGTLTVLIMGGALAVSTVVYLLDKRKGGQVVDLRPKADPMAYRSKDVQYGLVTVIGVDGTVKVEVHEPKQMFGQVLDALKDIATGLVGESTDAISSAVSSKVGDTATVEMAAGR